MICLTGDVHHSSLQTADIPYCQGTEIDASLRMAKIAEKYSIPLTLFFTGKCSKESPKIMKQIASMQNIEIAGHNYYAFQPRCLFDGYQKFSGLKNGPYFFQWIEVGKTKKALSKACQVSITSWRDHGYRHDVNTRKILASHKINVISDILSKNGGQPKWIDGVLDVPINCLPDHDYVFHGSRQPNSIDNKKLLNTHFAVLPMTKEKWLHHIKNDIDTLITNNNIATLLTHPACMEIFDDFYTFKQLCQHIKKYHAVLMKNLPQYV